MDNYYNYTLGIGIIKCPDHSLKIMNICTFSKCLNRLICPKCISKHDQFHIQSFEYVDEFLEKTTSINEKILKLREDLKSSDDYQSSSIDRLNSKIISIFDIISSKISEYLSSKQNYLNTKIKDQTKSKNSLVDLQNSCNDITYLFEKLNSSGETEKVNILIQIEKEYNEKIRPKQEELTRNDDIITVNKDIIHEMVEKIKVVVDRHLDWAFSLKEKPSFDPLNLKNKKVISDFETENHWENHLSVFYSHRYNETMIIYKIKSDSSIFNYCKLYSNELIKSFKLDKGRIYSLASYINPENLCPYSIIGLESCVQAFDMINLSLAHTYSNNGHFSTVNAFYHILHKKSYILGGCCESGRIICIWELSNPQILLRKIVAHTNCMSNIIEFYDSNLNNYYFLSCSTDTTVALSSMESDVVIKKYTDHSRYIANIKHWMNPLTNQVNFITSSDDCYIKMFSVDKQEAYKSFKDSSSVRGLEYYYNSQENIGYIITGNMQGKIKIYNSQSGEVVKIYEDHSQSVNTIILFHDYGKNKMMMVTGGNEGSVRVWEN